MELKRVANSIVKIVLPLILGGAILYWMYRGSDFGNIWHLMTHDMNWTWMLLSFPFGIAAQLLRGMRWRQTLEPVDEHPRMQTCVNSIFLSYAASLVIPRIGEFTRCGVLKRYDGVSFAKALGTVVTERAIDSLVVAAVTGLTLLLQFRIFDTFFDRTGTSMETIMRGFSPTGYAVTAICALAAMFLLHILLKKLAIYNKVRTTIGSILQGVMSLRRVKNITLFTALTAGIWVCYFLHYYLTFFCFGFTASLGMACALVTFVVGSIAVLVPTPNGAGPWHFAVKTMLILYGVAEPDALSFVLIVHTVQTVLVILLGVWAWGALTFTKRINTTNLTNHSDYDNRNQESQS